MNAREVVALLNRVALLEERAALDKERIKVLGEIVDRLQIEWVNTRKALDDHFIRSRPLGASLVDAAGSYSPTSEFVSEAALDMPPGYGWPGEADPLADIRKPRKRRTQDKPTHTSEDA